MSSAIGGLLLLMPFITVASSTTFAKSHITISSNCTERCGNVSIPYPFGIGPGCFRNGFEVTCRYNESSNSFRPFLGDYSSIIEIMDIALQTSHVRVYKKVVTSCPRTSTGGRKLLSSSQIWYAALRKDMPVSQMDLRVTPCVFSDTHNIFMVVGCNAVGYMTNEENELTSGCLSVCGSRASGHAVRPGQCSGIECCQTPVPKGLKYYNTNFSVLSNFTSPGCSYSVIANHDWFKLYKPEDYLNYSFMRDKNATVILEWAIRDYNTCRKAIQNQTTYACRSAHSLCIETTNGTGGYICNCEPGYEGNPYLDHGCQDIDECLIPNRCQGICINTEGSYNCSCPQRMYGDALSGKCFDYQQSKYSKRIIIDMEV